MKKICVDVLIPCWNEQQTISETIIEFHTSLSEGNYQTNFIVVDNNSTDNTASAANECFKNSNIKGKVVKEFRQGKGFAVRAGLKECLGNAVILVDGDSTYSSKNIIQMLNLVLNDNFDMVVGDRLSKGIYASQNRRNGHNIGNLAFTKLTSLLYGTKLTDVFSGLRVFSREFVMCYPSTASGFDVEIDLTLHSLDKRMKICEIPTDYRNRPVGSASKLNTVRDGIKILGALIDATRLYKPMLFYGIFSAIFAALGLTFGIFPISEYFQTGAVARVPLAVLSSSLFILSGLSLLAALILDSISKFDRRNFELMYVQLNKQNRNC